MNKENDSSLWDKFQMSGSIADYLNYKAGRAEEEKNNIGDGEKVTSDKGLYNQAYSLRN